jgi:hypothetical protein
VQVRCDEGVAIHIGPKNPDDRSDADLVRGTGKRVGVWLPSVSAQS